MASNVSRIHHVKAYIVKFLLHILIIFSARICDTEMRKSIYKEWLETTRPGSSEDMARLTDEHRIYFWGDMKQKIHEGSPRSLMDVKMMIGDFFRQTTEDKDLLKRITAQFCYRIKCCIQAKVGLFE